MTTVRELINLIGFEVDQQSESRARKAFEGVKAAALIAAKGAAIATGAIATAIQTTALKGDEIAKTADRLGLSTGALQEFQFAADLAGVSAQEFSQALGDFNNRAIDSEKGTGEAAEAYQRLGLSIRDAGGDIKSTEQRFMEAAGALSQIENEAERARLASRLFGEEGGKRLNVLLGQGAEGLAKAREEFEALGLGIDEEATRNSEAFLDAQNKIGRVLRTLVTSFAGGLIPAVTQASDAVLGFVRENRELIKLRIAQAVELMTAAVRGVIGFFSRLADTVGGVVPLLKIAAGIAAALAIAFFAVPIAIGAVVTGLALLIDDLTAWASGSPSLIGSFLGPFEKMPGALQNVFDIIGDTLRGFVDLVDAIFSGDLAEVMSALIGILTAPVRLIANALGSIVDAAIAVINGAIGALPSFITDNIGIGKIEFSAADTLDNLVTSASANLQAASDSALGAAVAPTAAAGPVRGDTNVNSNTTVNMTVNGGDPEETRRAMSDALDERDRQVREDAANTYGVPE